MLAFDRILRDEIQARQRSGDNSLGRQSDITNNVLDIVSDGSALNDNINLTKSGLASSREVFSSGLLDALSSKSTIQRWLHEILYLPSIQFRIGIKRLLSLPSLIANSFPLDADGYFGDLQSLFLRDGFGDVPYTTAYFMAVCDAWFQLIPDSVKHCDIVEILGGDEFVLNSAFCFVELVKAAMPLVSASSSATGFDALRWLVGRQRAAGVGVVGYTLHALGTERPAHAHRWLEVWLRAYPQEAGGVLVSLLCQITTEIHSSMSTVVAAEFLESTVSSLFAALHAMRADNWGCVWGVVRLIIQRINSREAYGVSQKVREAMVGTLESEWAAPLLSEWAHRDVIFRDGVDAGVSNLILSLMTSVPCARDGDVSDADHPLNIKFVSVSCDDAPVSHATAIGISLRDVFEGINSHFGSTSDASRRRGATVAVAYTTLISHLRPKGSTGEESLDPLNFEAYPRCLEDWINTSAIYRDEVTSPFSMLSGPPDALNKTTNSIPQKPSLIGSASLSRFLPLPVPPSLRIRLGGPMRVRCLRTQSVGRAEGFVPSFGKAQFVAPPKSCTVDGGPSGSVMPPVRTVLEGVRLLCGIGAKPNESERDRAMATEAALKALPSLLRATLERGAEGDASSGTLLHQRICGLHAVESREPCARELNGALSHSGAGITVAIRDRDEQEVISRRSDPFAAAEASLGPLASHVLMAVACCDIVFPKQIQEHMDRLRSEVLTLFIALTPLPSLHQVSQMLFHSNYSVSQRVMLYHGVQGAIQLWSQAPTCASARRPSDGLRAGIPVTKRRVYPPIRDDDEEHAAAMASAREAIAARVEQKTRRWGAAVRGRGSNGASPQSLTGTQNRVPFYAEAVLSTLLEFYDHHERHNNTGSGRSIHSFSFFGEADMLYCPSELMRTIYILFENFTAPAGGIITLSGRVLPFLIEGPRHPHTVVRAQAWMTIACVVNRFASAIEMTGDVGARAILLSALDRLTPLATDSLAGRGGTAREVCVLCRASISEFINVAMSIVSL